MKNRIKSKKSRIISRMKRACVHAGYSALRPRGLSFAAAAAMVLLATSRSLPAQVTSGGAGGGSAFFGPGGAGGASYATSGGNNGGTGVNDAGGGGGGGGYNGGGGGKGDEGSSPTGGTGGSFPAGNGSSGTYYDFGGSGGGGGALATYIFSGPYTSTSSHTGGYGGNGGGGYSGGGGGGGAGGYGFLVDGLPLVTILTLTNSGSGTITGGGGGYGGYSGFFNGGNGGDGGGGVFLIGPGTTAGTLNNSGSITGGYGGAGGYSYGYEFSTLVNGGAGGAGGSGVYYSGAGILNNYSGASITGGAGGYGGNGEDANGGAGGAGGAGVYFATSGTVNNYSGGSITGGAGGAGGSGYYYYASGATGGDGGAGVYFIGSGTANNYSAASIVGGAGGAGGSGYDGGNGGNGGIGIFFGSDDTVNNSGNIAGGAGGAGGYSAGYVTPADGGGNGGNGGIGVYYTLSGTLNNYSGGSVTGGAGGAGGGGYNGGAGGNGGVGAYFAAGGTVNNYSGGSITGGAGGGAGASSGTYADGVGGGAGGAGVFFTTSGTVNNYSGGSITGGAGGAGGSGYNGGGGGVGGAGVFFAASGTVNNSGSITGGYGGAGGTGSSSYSLATGGGGGAGGAGVFFTTSGTINNYSGGSITGGAGGAGGGAGGGGGGGGGGAGVYFTTSGTVNNSGSITGGAGGAGGAGSGTYTYSGEGGGGGAGVYFSDSGTINNDSGSSITGGAGGTGGSGDYAGGGGAGGSGVYFAASGTLKNYSGSSITGGVGGAGGGGYNGGAGGNGGAGVYFSTSATFVNNLSSITGGAGGAGGSGYYGGAGGSGGIGVFFSGSGTYNNAGSITGGAGGVGGNSTGDIPFGGAGGAGGAGVSFSGSDTFNNSGSITGGAGGAGGSAYDDGGNGGYGGLGVFFTMSGTVNNYSGSSITGGAGGSGYVGGSGGHGGAGVFFNMSGTVNNDSGSSITGGAGGAGGSGYDVGGAGGAGAAGVVFTTSGTVNNYSGSSIAGGAGGAGGSGTGLFATGGAGGAGGDGVYFTTSGTLYNSGSITGGAGGAGGSGFFGGGYGAGGIGVVGSSLAIILNGSGTYAGSISGGLGGDGVTRADAIDFTGGSNTLTIEGTNWTLTGDIEIDNGGSITFNQPTAETLNNVIFGDGSIIQAGPGSLTLGGANTYTGTTTIDSGTTLDVTGTLYTGFTYPMIPATVYDNGTFEVNNSFTIGDLDGNDTGSLILGSGDTLTINNQSGGTFAGSVSGDETSTLSVTGHHHSSEVLTGDLSNFSGAIDLSHNGMLDISGAQNNLDVKYDSGSVVAFYVDFDNRIFFGSGDGTLITGQGTLTSAQESDYSGYDVVDDKGEELGEIVLAADTHNATIYNNSDSTTLISGTLTNTLGTSARLVLEGNGSESIFELTSDDNSSYFTTGTLEIKDATVKFDNIDELPSSDPVPIDLDGGTLHSTGDAGLDGNYIYNPIELSYNGGTLDVGYSSGYYDYYYDANPVVYSPVVSGTSDISATYTGSPGTLSLINSADSGDYYYRDSGAIALTGVNTYSTATTIGSAEDSGGYLTAFAGNSSAFGSGSLTLNYTGSVGTTNDIVSGDSVGTGEWSATPIHITVSSFNSSASDEYVRLAITNDTLTNITLSHGVYTVNNANTSATGNDAIIVGNTTGAANLGVEYNNGAELYLETDPFDSSGGGGYAAHPRPYDFSRYVVVENNPGTAGGTITGKFEYAYDNSDDYVYQLPIQSNGNGGEELVVAIQTYFKEFANTPNEAAVANYLDGYATPQAQQNGQISPALTSALIALSQGSYAQIAEVLDEISPVDYANFGNQAIQNSTYNDLAIFGQIGSAFAGGGFNTGGLALLPTAGSAPDPFSTSLQSSLQSSAQMAQNAASLTSVNFMDDYDQTPPEPPQQSTLNPWSGFVSGDVIMSSLPNGNALGQAHETTGGITAGLDYQLNANWLVGVDFNYSNSSTKLDYLGSRQQTASYSPGLFVGYQNGPWYLDALGNYTYNNYRVDQNYLGGSMTSGKPTSNEYDAAALGGFYVPFGQNFQMGPAAGVAYTDMNVSSFDETGGPFALDVSSHSVESLRSLLGAQAKYSWTNSTLPVDINFNAYWQHEFMDSAGGISAGLSGLGGGGTFVFEQSGPTRDSALVGAGVQGSLSQSITLFANYEAQVGDKDVFGQSVLAGVAIGF